MRRQFANYLNQMEIELILCCDGLSMNPLVASKTKKWNEDNTEFDLTLIFGFLAIDNIYRRHYCRFPGFFIPSHPFFLKVTTRINSFTKKGMKGNETRLKLSFFQIF
jgi:hypothetical protein